MSVSVSETEERWQEKVNHQLKCVTRFDNLPNEVLLMICDYLTPVHVLKAFLNYDNRIFSCISEYREEIDLSDCSYTEFQYFLMLLIGEHLQPSTLIVNNYRMPTQIKIFFDTCHQSTKFHPEYVQHLSLLECTQIDLDHINTRVSHFNCLQSLCIVIESPSDTNVNRMDYSAIKTLRDIMFNSTFDTLTELELSISEGIILDKQLHPNTHLTWLTISLQQFDDLLVLFDGLAPKLIFLDVTVCQPDVSKRSSVPGSWSHRFMSHLVEFQLATCENVAMTFDHLRDIVMPLNRVEKFTLDVQEWISNDNQFVNGNQIDMLIRQYMTCLQHFHCSIQTMENIDKQTFTTMNEHWPMAYQSVTDSNFKSLYTIPWPLEELEISMLADDDTVSSCPNVQELTVDKPQTNLAHRFPNIYTLAILTPCKLSYDDYVKFRRLRYLITTDVTMIPSPMGRNIHSLTLLSTKHLLEHSTIYSNVRYLNLENAKFMPLTIITALVQHFPNLRSLECLLEPNAQYHDCLNVLLDDEHLPNLSMLKTNWIHKDTYCSNIQLWISAKTPLRWRSTPFLGHCHDSWLTICL